MACKAIGLDRSITEFEGVKPQGRTMLKAPVRTELTYLSRVTLCKAER